jgi:hypothetical protein
MNLQLVARLGGALAIHDCKNHMPAKKKSTGRKKTASKGKGASKAAASSAKKKSANSAKSRSGAKAGSTVKKKKKTSAASKAKKAGLYANIHAKQERIEKGSGEKMRKPGSKGAPTKKAFQKSARTAKGK